MFNNIVSLEDFGYPSTINDVINKSKCIFYDVIGGELLEVKLIGSAARGELTYKQIHNKLELLSDIEFLCVVRSRKALCYVNKIKDKLNKLKMSCGIEGALFDIDFGIKKNIELLCKA